MRFEYFSFNNFFEKINIIFQNNREKKFLGSMTIFDGKRRRATKMNITFSVETGYRILSSSFSRKNPHTGWMKDKKQVLGGHFLLHQWFYRADCVKKQCGSSMRGHASVWISWKLVFRSGTSVVCSCTYIVKILYRGWSKSNVRIFCKRERGNTGLQHARWGICTFKRRSAKCFTILYCMTYDQKPDQRSGYIDQAQNWSWGFWVMAAGGCKVSNFKWDWF